MTRPDIEWPKRLYGLRDVFLPVERAILTETYRALGGSASEIFRLQVQAMRRPQRTLSWTEVLFYPEPGRRSQWTDDDLFPNRHQDLKIAKVRFTAGGKSFTAFVHVVVGHFFAITSRPGLKSTARALPEISSVAILADPMDPLAAPPKKLPTSYTQFVSERGAGAHHGWEVLDPDEVYEVNLDGGAYWVLATQAGATFVLARQSGASFFVCEHDDRPQRIKGSFEQVLEQP